jgi:hypothetical protein
MKVVEKFTVVLGVSRNPFRYASRAMDACIHKGIPCVGIGKESFTGNGYAVQPDWTGLSVVHTISIYLRPELQALHYASILASNPKRLIFNPGTYNPELDEMARQAGIETLEACTLVLLSSQQF